MNNADWQLKKFIIQHPEYAGEYASGNLSINLFSDILRKNPRGIVAVSDLPHDLNLIGEKLAKSWKVTEQREKTPQKPAPGNHRHHGVEL